MLAFLILYVLTGIAVLIGLLLLTLFSTGLQIIASAIIITVLLAIIDKQKEGYRMLYIKYHNK